MDLRGKKIEEGYTNLVTVEGDSVANSGKLQNGQGTDLTNVEVTGSVTASSFIGDGSALTGITVANQSLDTTDDVNFNSVTAVGTVAANAFTGDGSSLTGVTKANQSLDTTDDVDFNTVTTVGNVTANAFVGDGSSLTGIEGGATEQERVAIMDLMMRQAEDDFDNSRTEIDFYGGFYDVFVNEDKIETALANIVSESNESPFYTVYGISFAKNGEKFYYNRSFGDGRYIVNSFNLSTAYDLSTATSAGSEVDFEGDVNTLYGYSDGNYLENLTIVDDGTHGLFMNENNNHVVSFQMSTAYDLSTKTNFKKNTNTTMFGGGNPTGVTMSDDGNYLYSHRGGAIRRHPMSTAYDISTASTTDKSAGISASGGIAISNDGTGLIAESGNGYNVYKLSTAWDVSTMTLVGSDTSVVQLSYDVDINDNHKQFFVNDVNNNVVNQRTVQVAYNPGATVNTVENLTVSAGAGGTVSHVSSIPLAQATESSNTVTNTRPSNSDRYWQDAFWSTNGLHLYARYQNQFVYVKHTVTTAFDPSGITWTSPTQTSGSISGLINGSTPANACITPTRLYLFANGGSAYWEDTSGNGNFDITQSPTSSSFNLFATMNQVKNDCLNAYPWFDNGNKYLKARNDSGFGDYLEIWQTSTPYQFEGSSISTSATQILSPADILPFPCFNKDGTKIFCRTEDNDLEEYTFSTPFDITTQVGTNRTSAFNHSGSAYTAYIQSNPSNANKLFVLKKDGLVVTFFELVIENADTDGTFQATQIDLSDAITGSPSAVVMTADGTDVDGNFSVSLSDGTNTVVVSTLDTEVDVSTLTSTTLTPTVEISNGAIVKSYALYFK